MEAFKGQIPFYLRGQHTLQIELDNEGVQAAEKGLSAVLDIGKRIETGEALTPEVT